MGRVFGNYYAAHSRPRNWFVFLTVRVTTNLVSLYLPSFLLTRYHHYVYSQPSTCYSVRETLTMYEFIHIYMNSYHIGMNSYHIGMNSYRVF